ncbi:MAG: GGDEF domain-containing protein [Chloroflexi bacterium]|nr:MAG: GGDEF domain-containing protein [Chloroflexota bacterium]TMG57306.1 MAG: GGDEF domain-containing protein [Chloroflexota bacterium]
MLVVVTLQSFVSSADLAIAISIAALSVSALRSGRRPRRMRSWLFFALASVTLVAHSAFGTQGESQADEAALFELLTLALFAIGFVLLYGADREQLRSIETRAELDPTTGLLNRQAFRELVAAQLRRPRRGPSAVAVVDLDGFKAVNDSRGHPAGDEVLGLVATAIRANLRTEDLASRYGGDEFVVYLADCPVDSALRIMERIRAVVEAVTAASGSTVTASVGLALSAGGTPDLDDLVDTADRALLSVKRSGKNQLLLGETV